MKSQHVLIALLSLFALWGMCAPQVLVAAQQSPPKTATTLRESMKAVLRFSPVLKGMQENREALRHMVRQSKAGWYPRVDVVGGSSVLQGSSDSTRQQAVRSTEVGTRDQVGLTMTQLLWDGNATTSVVNATAFREASAIHRMQDSATSVALDGAIAHINVLCRMENVRLAEANVETHRTILAKQDTLSASGISTSADAMQAQGRLVRAEATHAEMLKQLEEARISYHQLTGTEPHELAPSPMPDTPLPSLQTLLETTLAANPTIAATQADTKAIQKDREVVDAAYHPSLALEMGPSYGDTDTRLRSNYQWEMAASLRVRWNLYSGGSTEAEQKTVAARVRQSRQALYATADTLAAQVRIAWTSLQTAEKLITAYTAAVDYNTQTRNAYLEQFSVGIRSLLDVLDAESELFNSAIQLNLSRANRLISAYKLLALQGSLLQEIGVSLANLPSTSSSGQEALRR